MLLTDPIVLTAHIQAEAITVRVTALTNHTSHIQALPTVHIQVRLIVHIQVQLIALIQVLPIVLMQVQPIIHTPVLLQQRLQLPHIHLQEHHKLHL